MTGTSTVVDVRDMLCAQALAVVARAVESLNGEQRLEVLYNAEDVKRDLLVWAQDRGHRIEDAKHGRLHLGRTTRNPHDQRSQT